MAAKDNSSKSTPSAMVWETPPSVGGARTGNMAARFAPQVEQLRARPGEYGVVEVFEGKNARSAAYRAKKTLGQAEPQLELLTRSVPDSDAVKLYARWMADAAAAMQQQGGTQAAPEAGQQETS